jgi:hypothetical protein
MNSAATRVNEAEAELAAAKRRAKQVEAEQLSLCSDALDRLPRSARAALPRVAREQQCATQRERALAASSAYQRCCVSLSEAKAAAAAAEGRLLAAAGDTDVDVRLLTHCSDAASRVLLAEGARRAADSVHAAEAKRLGELLAQRQYFPKLSPGLVARCRPFVEAKAAAQAALAEEVRRLRAVRSERVMEDDWTRALRRGSAA